MEKNGEMIHNINPLDIIPLEQQSRSLIVQNLNENIKETDLLRVFKKYANVEVKLFKSKSNPPCAVIIFNSQQELELILRNNNNIRNNKNTILFDNEKLLLLINEDINIVKRKIEKMNRPENLTKILQKNPDELQNYFHFLLSSNILSFMAQSIRVREVWIGNLPQMTTRETIVTTFNKYGKVENCNHFVKQNQNFAFVKFESTESALNAINDQENLSLKFGVGLRMSFADFLKRFYIVGDSPSYPTKKENFSNILIILFNPSIIIPNNNFIKERFSVFGKVKNILSRPSINKDMKSYFLVELENVDQVKKARRFYNQEDIDGKNKYKLGDNKCEVNIVIKPGISANLYELLIPYLPKLDINEQNNILENFNYNKKLSYSLFWSGFFLRNKKLQVGTDAYLVYGNEKELLKDDWFNLILNQKISCEEFKQVHMKKEPKGVVIFRSSNETQVPKFNDLIDYLKKKNIIGVITKVESHLIYLIPYSAISKHYVHDCDVNDLVGVFISLEKGLNEVELKLVKQEILKNPQLLNEIIQENN